MWKIWNKQKWNRKSGPARYRGDWQRSRCRTDGEALMRMMMAVSMLTVIMMMDMVMLTVGMMMDVMCSCWLLNVGMLTMTLQFWLWSKIYLSIRRALPQAVTSKWIPVGKTTIISLLGQKKAQKKVFWEITGRHSIEARGCARATHRIKCLICQMNLVARVNFANQASSHSFVGLIPGNPDSSVAVDYHPGIRRGCCYKMPRHLLVVFTFGKLCGQQNTWTLFCSMSSPQVKIFCLGLDLRSLDQILQIPNIPTFPPPPCQRGQGQSAQLRVHTEVPSRGPRSQSLLARVECWHTNT